MTFAATGTGKGRACLVPALLTYEGTTVVVDPKGEAAAITAQRRRDMGHEVVVLDPFHATSEARGGLNPFDAQTVTRAADRKILRWRWRSFCTSDATGSHQDPFWDTHGDSLNSAVIAAVAATSAEEKRNVLSARDMLMSDDTVYNLAVLLDTKKKDLPPIAYQRIAAFLQTEEKCRSGILATAHQHYSILYGDGVEQSLAKTTFDLAGFRDGKPITIYLVVPAQKLRSHGALLRMWIGSLISVLLTRTQRPEIPTLFLLDEAAQLGELDGLRTLMTLMRGFGVRCWSFWQDLSQLKRLYPADHETLLNNASVVQIFGVTTHMMAKALSEILGESVRPQDLLEMPAAEELLLELGGKITRARKLDYLKDPELQGLYAQNPMFCNQPLPRSL